MTRGKNRYDRHCWLQDYRAHYPTACLTVPWRMVRTDDGYSVDYTAHYPTLCLPIEETAGPLRSLTRGKNRSGGTPQACVASTYVMYVLPGNWRLGAWRSAPGAPRRRRRAHGRTSCGWWCCWGHRTVRSSWLHPWRNGIKDTHVMNVLPGFDRQFQSDLNYTKFYIKQMQYTFT